MKTKKEMREEYKQLKFKMGVFQIRNTTNNKILVGSSNDLDSIWNRYKFALNMGGHPNTELQKDWTELSAEKFVYEILSELKQDETLTKDYRKEIKELEAMYLDDFQPYGNKGYNIKP